MLLPAIVAAPGLVFLFFSVGWLAGWEPRERTVAAATGAAFGAICIAVAVIFAVMWNSNLAALRAPLGDWFSVGTYGFPVVLIADRLSLPMIAMTAILAGIVGSFSRRYMHREKGFLRFFLLLHLFAFGAMLVFTAGSFDLMIGGWELVGISSVLLIAFFQDRPDPVRNAARVFGFYRVADLGLLTGIFALHHSIHPTSFEKLFPNAWPGPGVNLGTATATGVGLLFLLAASGKSAQGPFCGWLPRAMEGPTPSSAIFYGAISVHMGAYLLLRVEPMLRAAPIASAAVVVMGAGTALLGTISHRVASDAKASLSLASMTQLGIIFVEIGLGFTWLAVAHICGHAAVRTLQFLRAPSMLHDYHRMHSASGGHLETGRRLENLLPATFQAWLYRAGLDRGFVDAAVDRFVIAPAMGLSRGLGAIEPRRAPASRSRARQAAARQVAGGADA